MAGSGLFAGFFDEKWIILTGVFAVIGLLFFWVYSIAGRRRVTLDQANAQVLIASVSVLFKPRLKSYPLEFFGSVQSYVTLGKPPINRVELVSKTGGETLLLARFEPVNTARSFWSFPHEGESRHAQGLRRSVAEQFGLLDRGFLGSRMQGAQLKDC